MSRDADRDGLSIVPPPALLRRYTMRELLAEPNDFAWLVSGLLAHPTYGQVAGPMKALKSTVCDCIAVGVAAGVPVFGRFDPGPARPVLAYVGEGGKALWARRIRRICASLGVDPRDIDLHPCFEVMPIASSVFQETLRRDLDEVEPALVSLDPWYSYHGTTTRASDLHEEGQLLNLISTPCLDAGASLLLANHFNQSGTGSSLRRITMAGSGEWADSWVLLDHREKPDVAAGSFRLTMEVGSRQWGGATWDLDVELGRFDVDTGSHVGDITWELRPAHFETTTEKPNDRLLRARQAIVEAITDMPWQLSKTELRKLVGGRHVTFDQALGELVDEGRIEHDKRRRSEGGSDRTRLVWGLTPTRPLDGGTGSPSGAS